MAQYFARTKLAMKIVGLDAQKFNQAVSDGHYQCAPYTEPGATRIFDVNDMIGAVIFRNELERGVSPKFAGPFACRLRDYLRTFPDADEAICLVLSVGSDVWISPADLDPNATHWHDGGKYAVDIREVRRFKLAFIRQRIMHELDQASRTVGASE